MLFGVIADIHANPWALEAVFKELSDVEVIYVLGDLVGIGPRPRETVEMLMDDDRIRKVKGNHDHNTVHGTELGPTNFVPRKPHHDWVREQLGPGHLEYLEAENSIAMKDGDVEFRFMHSHPDDVGSKVPYYSMPFSHVLDRFYADVSGDVLFFGHTHLPLDVLGETGRRYVNPGAVGAQNKGRAGFVKVRTGRNGYELERSEVPYDVVSVVEELRELKIPYWEFIIHHFF